MLLEDTMGSPLEGRVIDVEEDTTFQHLKRTVERRKSLCRPVVGEKKHPHQESRQDQSVGGVDEVERTYPQHVAALLQTLNQTVTERSQRLKALNEIFEAF